MALHILFLLFFVQQASCLIPPMFQWKTIDYAWENNKTRDTAIENGLYIPENNMPAGLVRWQNKLFILVPRLKTGVPSSLNYIYLDGDQAQYLNPYPNWNDALAPFSAAGVSNSSVVCAFKAHVDSSDRLWVVDNGVSDITGEVQQISEPAILIFDLNSDQLVHKFVLRDDVLKDSSVFTSIVVDDVNCGNCCDTYAYITDMGSNAIVVYSLTRGEAWRVENPYFHFDPHSGVFKVGGIDFYWSDGVSSAALSNLNNERDRDLYFHPTSSTKQFVMSTSLLRDKDTPNDDIFNGVRVVGDRGPMSQATACDFDPQTNVLFYTQLSKNGVGCWNTEKPFNTENNPLVFSDCNMMEFPIDLKIDRESNVWMLSNRQSRFLFGAMDFSQINFRVLEAPASALIRGSTCERKPQCGSICKVLTNIMGSKSFCSSCSTRSQCI